MLTLRRDYHARTGQPLAGFRILADGKTIAVGEAGCYVRWLAPVDRELANRVAELAGLRAGGEAETGTTLADSIRIASILVRPSTVNQQRGMR